MPIDAPMILLVLVLALALCGAYMSLRRKFARAQQEAETGRARLQASLEAQAQAFALRGEQLQRATTLQGEWAARVDGDLLGAAQAIAHASRLLRLGELPTHLREQVERIDASVHRLRTDLTLLADSVQLEAGTLALAPELFDFDTLLEDFSEAIAARTGGRARELVVEVEPDVPPLLLGDAPRLIHLLLAQAEMLSGPGRGDLCVHIGLDEPRVGLPAPAAGERLCLRFEISADRDPSESELPDVPSLAADIRLRLIQLMEGLAGLREVAGQGHVAWFTARLEVAQALTEGEPDVGAIPALHGRRVLVVDDSERVRTMLVRLLGHWGLAAVAVKSGYAAIEAAAMAENAGPGFELMLLDADMPELDGLEAVRLLGTRGLRSPPQVVLMSTAPTGGMLARAQAAGVAEVLGKPLGRRALRQTLEQLSRHAGGAASRAAAPAVQREAGMPEALLALGGARVLLVEDNEINQQIALELLQASGMNVELAEHGQIALDLLNWQYFDLVLMDLQMPVLDGLSATRLIRADRRHAALPIIAMTATGSQLERQRCLEAGMNAHLIKPFDLDSLWEVLQRWIKPRPGLGQAQDAAESAQGPAPELLRSLPKSIPGFDVRRALGRMGDRVDLYMRTARMFVDTQGDTVEQVREALAAGDRQTAIRLATTLKNLAGNLGAEGLQTEALALEAVLRDGAADSPTQARTARVEEALEVACFALKSMLIAGSAKTLKPGVSAAVTGPAD